jgi:hypothetical protein
MAAVMSPSKVHCNFIEKNPWLGGHSQQPSKLSLAHLKHLKPEVIFG